MSEETQGGSYVFVPEESEALILIAPKGTFGGITDQGVRELQDVPMAVSVLVDVLEYATKGYFTYYEPLPPAEQLIRIAEKLVKILNGKVSNPAVAAQMKTFLGPHASKREKWPVLAEALESSLPPDYRDFALKNLKVGSQKGALKGRKNPSLVTVIADGIFRELKWLLEDPEHRVWPYGYLREQSPSLSVSNWDFWSEAVGDDLTLKYGSPEAATEIRKRRFEFSKTHTAVVPFKDWRDLTPEENLGRRKKLDQKTPAQTDTTSKKVRRAAAWNFAKAHPEITKYLLEIRSGEITGSRGLFNLLKRETLKAVKNRISLFEKQTKPSSA